MIRLKPKLYNGQLNPIFNPADYTWTNEDVIIAVQTADYNYKTQIQLLQTQVDKLTQLVVELQKLTVKVDDKATDIAAGVQQLIENEPPL